MEIGQEARILGDDFIRFRLGRGLWRRPPSKHAETLRRVGREADERYDGSWNVIEKNDLFEMGCEEAFNEILNAMFEEGECNWGRIVMVYVFAARLAKYCLDRQKPQRVDEIISMCGKYVDEKLSPWIQKQGGWDNFNENFKAKDWREKESFNCLLIAASLIGGLAALRFFATKS